MGAGAYAAAGAGLGFVKGLIDGPRERREAKLRAEQIRLSPWISVPLQEVHQADPLGNALQGGVSGFAQGQKVQDSADAKAFNDKYLDILAKKPGGQVNASLSPMGGQQASMQGGYFDAPSPRSTSAWTLF